MPGGRWSRGGGHFAAAVAKLIGNESAREAIKASHQAHGAIGMTREYPLHEYTRRLNAWRREFGNERQVAGAIGKHASQAPSFAQLLAGVGDAGVLPLPAL